MNEPQSADDIVKHLQNIDMALEWHRFTDAIQAFTHAVDWSEPWLIALLCMHVLLLCVILWTRRNMTVQTSLFALVLLTARAAEPLDSLAVVHWRSFAGQNYFGGNGAFMAVVYCTPLVLLAMIIVINFVVELFSSLVIMKRQQLLHQQKKKTK